MFALDPDPDAPTLVQHTPSGGKTPRHFSLSPDGRFLLVANQDAGNLVRFAVDPDTGRLTRQGELRVGASPYYVNFVRLATRRNSRFRGSSSGRTGEMG